MHGFESNAAHEGRSSPLLVMLAAATIAAGIVPTVVPLIVAPRPSLVIASAVLLVISVCCVLSALFAPRAGIRASISTAIAALLAVWTLLLIVSVGLLLIPALVFWSTLAAYQLKRTQLPSLPADVVVMGLALILCFPIALVLAFALGR